MSISRGDSIGRASKRSKPLTDAALGYNFTAEVSETFIFPGGAWDVRRYLRPGLFGISQDLDTSELLQLAVSPNLIISYSGVIISDILTLEFIAGSRGSGEAVIESVNFGNTTGPVSGTINYGFYSFPNDTQMLLSGITDNALVRVRQSGGIIDSFEVTFRFELLAAEINI